MIQPNGTADDLSWKAVTIFDRLKPEFDEGDRDPCYAERLEARYCEWEHVFLCFPHRREARARQKIVAAILPTDCLITKPEAFYAWLKLTNGWSADSFVRAAYNNGIGVTPFNVFEVASLNH